MTSASAPRRFTSKLAARQISISSIFGTFTQLAERRQAHHGDRDGGSCRGWSAAGTLIRFQ